MAAKTKTSPDHAEGAAAARSKAKRKARIAQQLASELDASAVGITPKWQRAIDTYKRVKAERVTE
jgi:hypothetical protein